MSTVKIPGVYWNDTGLPGQSMDKMLPCLDTGLTPDERKDLPQKAAEVFAELLLKQYLENRRQFKKKQSNIKH